METSDVEDYARAAAGVTGLEIDAVWWPAVVRHLAGMLERAASVEAVVISECTENSAAVFHP